MADTREISSYDFIESAFKAGYPYVLRIDVTVEGQLDSVEFRSYKDCINAWRDASRKLGQVFDDYKKEEIVWAHGHIWRCSEKYGITQHDLICTIGSYDRGSSRNLVYEHKVVDLR